MHFTKTAGLQASLMMLMLLGLIAPASSALGQPKAEIGVNLDGIADWMTSAAYIDATAYFRRWGKPGAGWEEHPALRLTADNLPLVDADAISYLHGYPNGLYTLRYEGQANVQLMGIAVIVPGSLKKVGDITTAQVKVSHNGPEDLATLQVRGVDPNKPLRRLELISPGYVNATSVFRSEFVRRVRPFPTLRFMDWGQTNESPVKEWADRGTPHLFGRTSHRGTPIEEMVLLANITQRDIWVNVPHLASEDYIRKLAEYLRENLHKDAILRVEYSNELWNFGFGQAKDNLLAARARGGLSKPEDFGKAAQNAADRLGKIAVLFKEVFGAADFEKRVRCVVGGFIASAYWGETQLDFLKANYPGLVKEIAIAPYFGVEGDIKPVDVPGATADQLFDWCDKWIDTTIAGWVREHRDLAKKHGIGLVAYEAGVHLTANNGVNEQTKQAMQANPRMAKTLGHLIDVWRANGGGLFMQFGHIGPYSRSGYWALLESADLKGSVKWDFYMSKLLPVGDVDLDGKVTAADVGIVEKNMGKKGAWREDGDVNGDGQVDGADLMAISPR